MMRDSYTLVVFSRALVSEPYRLQGWYPRHFITYYDGAVPDLTYSPLYNAELAPPEIRGLLVAMQQLATTLGIMIAYWICYGTNYIGGTCDSQSNIAWRLPLIIQGVPAVILAVGVWFLPYSPRLLINHGRDDEALRTLGRLRQLPSDDRLVQIEFLEIKTESVFESRNLDKKFPQLASKTRGNRLLRQFFQYSLIFCSRDAFKRVSLGSLVMFFQQWSGIDSSKLLFTTGAIMIFTCEYILIMELVIYYAPIVFRDLGLTDNTVSLLATGVVGVINVVTTIPALFIIDKVGRKPLLICGSTGMLLCQLVTGIIVAKCQDDWTAHRSAGWAAVVMIWLYIFNFAYSWGPGSWTLIAEIFPLSIRTNNPPRSISNGAPEKNVYTVDHFAVEIRLSYRSVLPFQA